MFFSKKIVVTHSGDFHADDAFAVATLSLLHRGSIKVIRSRRREDWDRGDYVVDVGEIYDHTRRRYDHHQRGGAGVRPDGVPYAAFGLVWKHYGAIVSRGEDVSRRVEKTLVEPIDAGDNGFPITTQRVPVYEYVLSNAITAFRTSKKGAKEEYRDFLRAVDWAKGVLSREIVLAKTIVEDTKKARRAYDDSPDKRIVIMNEELFWIEALRATPDAIFAVFPDSIGQWRVKAVQEDGFRARKDLPESWAGLSGDDLVRVTGVSDAVFAHTKRFIAVAKSKEGALALAKKAIEA